MTDRGGTTGTRGRSNPKPRGASDVAKVTVVDARGLELRVAPIGGDITCGSLRGVQTAGILMTTTGTQPPQFAALARLLRRSHAPHEKSRRMLRQFD
jgi:hypothetical protein